MWTPPPSQPQFYGRVSPPSQMNTMSPLQQQFNTSPTGSVHHHRIPPTFRQLHPPKSPLYRPAVLRAIDRPLTSVISSPAGSPKLLSEEYESEYRREGDISSEDGYDQDFDEEICEEDDGVRCTGPPVRTHWKVRTRGLSLCLGACFEWLHGRCGQRLALLRTLSKRQFTDLLRAFSLMLPRLYVIRQAVSENLERG